MILSSNRCLAMSSGLRSSTYSFHVVSNLLIQLKDSNIHLTGVLGNAKPGTPFLGGFESHHSTKVTCLMSQRNL